MREEDEEKEEEDKERCKVKEWVESRRSRRSMIRRRRVTLDVRPMD